MGSTPIRGTVMSMWRNWQRLVVRIRSWALYRDVAQLVARLIWDQDAVGSSPVIPAVCIRAATGRRGRFKPDLFEGSNPSGCIK